MGSATTPSPLEFIGARFILLEQLRGKPALQACKLRANIRCFQARREESCVKSVFFFEPYRNDDQRAYRNGRPDMDSKGRGEADGVSTATVSRVVNGTRNVSCEARTKVLGAVSRLQYRPTGMRRNWRDPMRAFPKSVALLHRARAAGEQGDWQSLSENAPALERVTSGFEQGKNP